MSLTLRTFVWQSQVCTNFSICDKIIISCSSSFSVLISSLLLKFFLKLHSWRVMPGGPHRAGLILRMATDKTGTILTPESSKNQVVFIQYMTFLRSPVRPLYLQLLFFSKSDYLSMRWREFFRRACLAVCTVSFVFALNPHLSR